MSRLFEAWKPVSGARVTRRIKMAETSVSGIAWYRYVNFRMRQLFLFIFLGTGLFIFLFKPFLAQWLNVIIIFNLLSL